MVDTFSFAGTGNVPAGNNATGFADYLLSNFSSFLATDRLQFHFVLNNANGAAEDLFVIGASPINSVPEPGSLLLLGSGLIVMVKRFRKKAKIYTILPPATSASPRFYVPVNHVRRMRACQCVAQSYTHTKH